MWCFEEKTPEVFSEVLADFTNQKLSKEQVIQQCANKAHAQNYPVFVIQGLTKCKSGPALASGGYVSAMTLPKGFRKTCEAGPREGSTMYMYTNSKTLSLHRKGLDRIAFR